MTRQGLSCQELVELVTDYLEGALPPADRARFDEHIAGCASCEAYLEQMRLTISAASRLSEETVSAEAQEQLLQAFRGWKQEQVG